MINHLLMNLKWMGWVGLDMCGKSWVCSTKSKEKGFEQIGNLPTCNILLLNPFEKETQQDLYFTKVQNPNTMLEKWTHWVFLSAIQLLFLWNLWSGVFDLMGIMQYGQNYEIYKIHPIHPNYQIHQIHQIYQNTTITWWAKVTIVTRITRFV